MKELYAVIAEDISLFRSTRNLPVRIDALTACTFYGIHNVRHFIRRYWKGRVVSENDSSLDYYREWSSRQSPYQRPSIPSDEVVTNLLDLSVQENGPGIIRKLREYYQVTGPSLISQQHPQMDYYLMYDPISTIMIVNKTKLHSSESVFFAILQGFFRHLAKTRGWRFSKDMVKNNKVEKREATLFAKRICERLVELGLMRRKR